MGKDNSIIQAIWMTYGFIGVLVASISLCSMFAYYGFGPGAFWNIGFFPCMISAFFGFLLNDEIQRVLIK